MFARVARWGVVGGVLLVVVGLQASCDRLGGGVEATGGFTNSCGVQMVELSSGYYVAAVEISVHAYACGLGEEAPLTYTPKTNITHAEALEWCRAMTIKDAEAGVLPAGFRYDLPTWAQWIEYGAGTPLAGSITPAGGYSGDSPRPVGSGRPNSRGLYNIRGNVSEFLKPEGPRGTGVIAGADWGTLREDFLELDNKSWFADAEATRSPAVGFRCVLVPG